MLHDIVTARLRESDIPITDYSPGSVLPHLLATLRVWRSSPATNGTARPRHSC